MLLLTFGETKVRRRRPPPTSNSSLPQANKTFPINTKKTNVRSQLRIQLIDATLYLYNKRWSESNENEDLL